MDLASLSVDAPTALLTAVTVVIGLVVLFLLFRTRQPSSKSGPGSVASAAFSQAPTSVPEVSAAAQLP